MLFIFHRNFVDLQKAYNSIDKSSKVLLILLIYLRVCLIQYFYSFLLKVSNVFNSKQRVEVILRNLYL